MRDVFFTILAIWVLWRLFGSRFVIQSSIHKNQDEKEARIKVDPSSVQKTQKYDDNEGDYVDYEEIK